MFAIKLWCYMMHSSIDNKLKCGKFSYVIEQRQRLSLANNPVKQTQHTWTVMQIKQNVKQDQGCPVEKDTTSKK